MSMLFYQNYPDIFKKVTSGWKNHDKSLHSMANTELFAQDNFLNIWSLLPASTDQNILIKLGRNGEWHEDYFVQKGT